MCRPFIAEQEGGECTAAPGEEQRGECDRYCGGGEARPGHAVETTEQESKDRAEIRATREHHQRERRGKQRGDGVADEQHAGDALLATPDASDTPDQRHRGERADERGELHAAELPGDSRNRQQEGDRRTERCAATGAEHIRIGERVAQQRLERGTRCCQRRANGDRGEDPRQADLHHD